MKKTIQECLKERILIIDGAMGTMIQRHKLNEEDYRGERFKNWPSDVKGNNDLLSITQPAIIEGIHTTTLKITGVTPRSRSRLASHSVLLGP